MLHQDARIRKVGSEQLSIGMGPTMSVSSLNDRMKSLEEQMKRAFYRLNQCSCSWLFILFRTDSICHFPDGGISNDVSRDGSGRVWVGDRLKNVEGRLSQCSCADLSCVPLLMKCVVNSGHKCCPVTGRQTECKVMGEDKETKCCVASGNTCAKKSMSGEKQCCDRDESCILKG